MHSPSAEYLGGALSVRLSHITACGGRGEKPAESILMGGGGGKLPSVSFTMAVKSKVNCLTRAAENKECSLRNLLAGNGHLAHAFLAMSLRLG